MKLTDRVYLIGSGDFGFNMTHALDCHVFLVDGGGELALIDAGIGLETEGMLDNVRAEGFDPSRIEAMPFLKKPRNRQRTMRPRPGPRCPPCPAANYRMPRKF